MGRRTRAWEPGGVYHLTPKGNDDKEIFCDDIERLHLIELATAVFAAHDVTVLGYCVMTTHAHFFVRSGLTGLSFPMRELFGRYSRWWSRRHARRGNVFQNRCHVTDVTTDAHLMVAAAYIDLNPVRAMIVDRPEAWRWSSYRAHIGLERPLALLANDEFLAVFGQTPEVAHDEYRRYVLSWQRHDAKTVSDTARDGCRPPTSHAVSDTWS